MAKNFFALGATEGWQAPGRWDGILAAEYAGLSAPENAFEGLAQLKAAVVDELRQQLPSELIAELRPYIIALVGTRVHQEVSAQLNTSKLQFGEMFRAHVRYNEEQLRGQLSAFAAKKEECGAVALKREVAELCATLQQTRDRQREEIERLRTEMSKLRALVETRTVPEAPFELCSPSQKKADDSLFADLREFERCLTRNEKPPSVRGFNTLFGDTGLPARAGVTPKKPVAFGVLEERETLHLRLNRPAAEPHVPERLGTLPVRLQATALPSELPRVAQRGNSSRPEASSHVSVSKTNAASSLTKLQDLSTNLRARPALIPSLAPAASPDDSILKYVNDVRLSRHTEAARREWGEESLSEAPSTKPREGPSG